MMTRLAAWLDRDAIAAIIFLSPALLFLGIFLFYPIVYLLYLSFTTGSFTVSGIEWVGTRNYLRLFTDADFWQIIGNTLYFTIATVMPTIIIPLGLALLLNRTLALRGLLRAAYFIPSMANLSFS